MMNKNRKLCVRMFLFIIAIWCCFSLTAFADTELVPYEPTDSQTPAVTSTAAPNTSGKTDYAGDLFVPTKVDNSTEVNGWITQFAKVASTVLTVVIGIVPTVLALQMIVDVCCILLRPVAELVSHLPWQINSDEVIMITGIQHVSPGEGNGNSSSIQKKDLKGENPFLFYLKSRLMTIIIAITIFMLLGTGVMFKIIFWCANFIVNLIAGIV